MKLWIIYNQGIGFSMIIAEMLQERLEDSIDVSVGNAKKIEPAFLVEEGLDYLIIGDVISEVNPSLEIQNWLLKFWEIAKTININLKAISGFYIMLTDNTVKPFWVEFIHDNAKVDIIYPPILCLKLNLTELSLENKTSEIVKRYSDDFIEYLINTN
ncbi:MAG: hypothetical protein JSV62_06300 [Promethearchaeota archaeon]|nr:MAG: hypothetical protein JSV62_06300 [Candidatus Lokiarchaeota archaeon]